MRQIESIWFEASVRLVTIVWSDSQGNDNIITQVDKGQFLSATTHSINVAKLSRTKKLIHS